MPKAEMFDSVSFLNVLEEIKIMKKQSSLFISPVHIQNMFMWQ